MKSESGTVSRFAASEKQVLVRLVRVFPLVVRSGQPLTLVYPHLALYEADRLAHAEAIQNGGLIMYWYGVPNPTTGMNLATCIWQSRKHAVAANSRPHHVMAVKLAAASYEVYTLERHVLRKAKGDKGITVESFNGGDVGW